MSDTEKAEAAKRVLGFVRTLGLGGGPNKISSIGLRFNGGDVKVFELLASDLELLIAEPVTRIAMDWPGPLERRCELWVPDMSGVSVRRRCGQLLNDEGLCPRPMEEHGR